MTGNSREHIARITARLQHVQIEIHRGAELGSGAIFGTSPLLNCVHTLVASTFTFSNFETRVHTGGYDLQLLC